MMYSEATRKSNELRTQKDSAVNAEVKRVISAIYDEISLASLNGEKEVSVPIAQTLGQRLKKAFFFKTAFRINFETELLVTLGIPARALKLHVEVEDFDLPAHFESYRISVKM